MLSEKINDLRMPKFDCDVFRRVARIGNATREAPRSTSSFAVVKYPFRAASMSAVDHLGQLCSVVCRNSELM